MKQLALVTLLTLPSSVFAASFYITPDTATYGPGDTFVASIRLDTQGECMNAARVDVVYPSSLRAEDFSKGESIFSLWAEEPHVDAQNRIVSFSGGIPGGYCGRIQGDPSLSNILGKIIFSVARTNDKEATIGFASTSVVYLHDGIATKAKLVTKGATYTLAPAAQLKGNAWVDEVKNDVIPPEPFDLLVESTKGVFGGTYYLVFTTQDKQTGVDHYEYFENGGWSTVTSPLELRFPFLHKDIQIRAVDKAGNFRVGSFSPENIPERQFSYDDLIWVLGIMTVVAVVISIVRRRRAHYENT